MTLSFSTAAQKEVVARGVGLFSQITNNRTRGNGFKLHQGKFSVEIRKIFSGSAVKHWSSLQGSGEVIVPRSI